MYAFLDQDTGLSAVSELTGPDLDYGLDDDDQTVELDGVAMLAAFLVDVSIEGIGLVSAEYETMIREEMALNDRAIVVIEELSLDPNFIAFVNKAGQVVLTRRLFAMPGAVFDCVVTHELVHVLQNALGLKFDHIGQKELAADAYMERALSMNPYLVDQYLANRLNEPAWTVARMTPLLSRPGERYADDMRPGEREHRKKIQTNLRGEHEKRKLAARCGSW